MDGTTTLAGLPATARVGDLVRAVVTGTDGVDLRAGAAPMSEAEVGPQRQQLEPARTR